MDETEIWSPIARLYDPVTNGSIDGTDVEPHDRAIVRALNSTYRPNVNVTGDPECTAFIARLNHSTDETRLKQIFSRYGPIKNLRLARDVVTGFSKGYAFVEYYEASDVDRVYQEAHQMVIDDKEILVDYVCARSMPGWVPRRLGGGHGGLKESGQLRFGCRDRPFRKPIYLSNEDYQAGLAHSRQYGRYGRERKPERLKTLSRDSPVQQSRDRSNDRRDRDRRRSDSESSDESRRSRRRRQRESRHQRRDERIKEEYEETKMSGYVPSHSTDSYDRRSRDVKEEIE